LVFLLALLPAMVSFAADQPETSPDQPGPTSSVEKAAPAGEAESTSEEEPAPQIKKQRVAMGLMIGSYNPVDSKLKDVFGSHFVRYGIRPIPLEVPTIWRISWDASFYWMSRDVAYKLPSGELLRYENNEATLIPLTAGFIRGFGKGKTARSYAAVNAGIFYGHVDVPTIGAHKSGLGLNANLTVGTMLQKRLALEARYEWFDEFAGLDFSAFTISATLKLFEMKS
jgi:hypothetical protein